MEWIPVLISFCALVSALFFNGSLKKKKDINDEVEKAKESATLNVKLDQIGRDVQDIKYDMSATKKEVQLLSERMVAVETSTKSAHKRMDDYEKAKKG